MDKAFLDSFCEANGFAGWFATSAKENTNITASGQALVKSILTHRDIFEQMRQARADVFHAAVPPPSSSGWCCAT